MSLVIFHLVFSALILALFNAITAFRKPWVLVLGGALWLLLLWFSLQSVVIFWEMVLLSLSGVLLSASGARQRRWYALNSICVVLAVYGIGWGMGMQRLREFEESRKRHPYISMSERLRYEKWGDRLTHQS